MGSGNETASKAPINGMTPKRLYARYCKVRNDYNGFYEGLSDAILESSDAARRSFDEAEKRIYSDEGISALYKQEGLNRLREHPWNTGQDAPQAVEADAVSPTGTQCTFGYYSTGNGDGGFKGYRYERGVDVPHDLAAADDEKIEERITSDTEAIVKELEALRKADEEDREAVDDMLKKKEDDFIALVRKRLL